MVICLDSKKIKTRNIVNSISKFAAENVLKSSEYTFNINTMDTYIKTISEDDYTLYNEDIHKYYDNYDEIIDKHVEFQQLYTITVKKSSKRIIDLKYTIVYSDNNIVPSIVLHPDSKIPYKKYEAKEMYLLLLKELNKIKAEKKILIKIFDLNMKEKLKAFVKYLYQGKFTKKIKIPLFDGIEPEITVRSRLIKHYLKKKSSHQIIEVEPKELLAEYIKPVFGKNGLNAFGKIVTHDHKKNKDDIDQGIIDTTTIDIIDSKEKRQYRSKIKGFVHFDENRFYVDNKIKMKTLSSVQDEIATVEDNNIEVIVAQHDTDIDSVGEGVNLKSETIHITGHIGAKSFIEANNLEIDGATHKNSEQNAKFAKINRHKGMLRCHSADIKLLEGGEVHATDVNIEAALNGTVYAENVTIGHVKNNLKVYASHSVNIKLVSGEDNLFKINYLDVSTLMNKYRFIDEEIEDLKYQLEGAMKHTESQVPVLKDKINKLKAEQEDIRNSAKSAKITIKEPLRGLNTITFCIDKDNEITYKTDARNYKEFYLEESDGSITLKPTDKKISIDS